MREKARDLTLGFAIILPVFFSPAIAAGLGWYGLRDALLWIVFVIPLGLIAPALGLFHMAMLAFRVMAWLAAAVALKRGLEKLQHESD